MDYKELITEEVEMLPPRIIMYGEGGIGKTTLATKFPKPILIRAENGAAGIKGIGKLPTLTSIDEFESQLDYVIEGSHSYRTLIIDPIDEIQKLKEKDICRERGVVSIMDVGWGKGSSQLRAYFDDLRWKLDRVQARGLIVILIAHYKIEEFQDPVGDNFNFFTMNLEKEVWPKMRDWSDFTAFINYETFTKIVDKEKKTVKAVNNSARRFVYTTKRPAFVAKNRYSLPDILELYEGNPQATADEMLNLIRKDLTDKDAAGRPVKEEVKAAEPEKVVKGKKKNEITAESLATTASDAGASAA
jgi:hypothetical protein